VISKTKSQYAWKTGFALFGADLDDGYSILWRRFNYRRSVVSGRMQTCRYGKTAEYEAQLEAEQNRPPPPSFRKSTK